MSGNFKFSQRSLNNLNEVHEELVAVVKKALTLSPYDFIVIDGKRTIEEQKELFRKGKSKTLNSRHLTGHAVDLLPLVKGKAEWKDINVYKALANAMYAAAKQNNIPLRWGGDWDSDGKIDRFFDGGHFELPKKYYP